MIKEAIEKRLKEIDAEIEKIGHSVQECFASMSIWKAKKAEHVDLLIQHAKAQLNQTTNNVEVINEQQNASTNEQPSSSKSSGGEQPIP